MDLTRGEILNSHLTFGRATKLNVSRESIYKAMGQYAKQEAIAFANWISNQVLAGRTITRLWDDFQKETLPQTEKASL